MNIFKKADELSILCDTDVAVILFQPADEGTTAQPVTETWPKDPTEFKRIIGRYKAKLASSHASSPSTSLPAIKDTTRSSSSSSSSSFPLPSPSPSPSVLGKRHYLDLESSLSCFHDSRIRISKEDRGKKKLRVDNDENINFEDLQYECHINGHAAGKDELYKRDNEFRTGYDDLEAKLCFTRS